MANKLFIFLVFLITTKPLFAYLDPGIASFIIQSIVGGIAVGLGVISIYWNKFKSLFSKNKDKKKNKKN